MDRLLVVLDLDETLVHAPDRRLARAPDLVAGPYPIYLRPCLQEFLDALRTQYAVAIWTAAGRDYAEAVVMQIVPWFRELAFFWCADRCTQSFDHETRGHNTIKKLSKIRKLGYDLARVVVIDDSPEKHIKNYGNLIPIAPYYGDETDVELPAVLKVIHALAATPNVRAIEKRFWRHDDKSR